MQLIIFYLRSSTNDLEGIIFANTISEGVGIVLHIIINYNCIYKYIYLKSKNTITNYINLLYIRAITIECMVIFLKF